MLKDKFLKLSLSSLFIFFFSLSFLSAVFGNFSDFYDRDLKIAYKNRRREAEREYRTSLRKEYCKLKEELEDLKKKYKAMDGQVDNAEKEQLESEIKDAENELGFIRAELGGSLGDTIFRGIAGQKAWGMVEDLKVGDDIIKGFYNGVALRGSLSIGDAIGSSIDKYVSRLFGEGLGKIEDFVSYIYRAIFHSSCKSFTVEEINSWKNLVVKDLVEIEKMIKNAEKYDSRGRVEILKEFESQVDESSQSMSLWKDFIEDLVQTYEDLSKEIGIRQGYYKEENGFGVVKCAQRLKNKLLKAKNWLLSVKSLKDFASTPEVKSIIPSMKKSFENYFDNLAEQVKPLSIKKNDIKISSSPFPKDRWGSDDPEENIYPGFMR